MLRHWVKACSRSRGLVLLASFLACSAPAQAPLGVVQRLEEAAGQRAAALKLGTRARPALTLPAGASFEVELERPARSVVFSTAGPGDAAVRFSLGVAAGGAWQELFAERAPAGEPAWRDHRIELPDGVRRVRFESTAEDGPEGASVHWGGVAFLGEVPALRDAPNVILVSLDTLAAPYLSAYGDVPGVSPRIDALLERGFAFERTLAQYGNTLVSHASLFSGLYPRHHGLYPENPFVAFRSLVESLARAGYRTTAFTEGAYVSSAWGFDRGFDAYDDGARGLHAQMAGNAARTFRRAGAWLRQNPGSRFFLFVHTYEVHSPYLLTDDSDRALANRVTPGDSREFPESLQAREALAHNEGRSRLEPRDLRRLRALHLAEIHRLDSVVGDFLETLDSLGLGDTTLVVLTSDHGDQFGERGVVGHGNSLSNRVLHVPLAFAWPGHLEPGASATPVQLVDVLPTVLELAGLEVPPALDGRSLVPAMRGEPLPERPAFSELRNAPSVCRSLDLPDGCRLDRYAVQTGRFKLIRSQRPAFEELYDLAADPLEAHDVAAEQPEALQAHRALLDAYLASPAHEPASDEGAVDAQTLRQLKALGYIP